mmetsp:Transcript_49053/g.91276  ORF Transcript_49053/g.91276 Transcript_49053/m.91276 type:complete len:144 (+) Transcript_49053:719-1150(+)
MINARLLPEGASRPPGGELTWACRPPFRRRAPDSGGCGPAPLLDLCDGFTESLQLGGGEGGGGHSSSQQGDSEEDSEAPQRVLTAALAHVRSRAAADGCQWQWAAGDVVLMDNHRCLHRATGGCAGARRELWRVLLSEWHGKP